MNKSKRYVLLILVILFLGLPAAAATAANESAVKQTFRQTAVSTLLTQFAEPDCLATGEMVQPPSFDMAQPVPNCWLLIGQKEIQIE